MALFLRAVNDEDYWNTITNNALTADVISPGGVSATSVNSQYVTINSATTVVALTAVTTSNADAADWPLVITRTLAAPTVAIGPNPAGITIGEVRTAVDTADVLQDVVTTTDVNSARNIILGNL